MYLEAGERARQAAALDQASRMPVGNGASWVDETTRAAGRVIALSDHVGPSGSCRDYRIIIDVPARTMMVWTSSFNTYNNAATPRQMPQQMSPAHTREYLAEICGTAAGFAAAGR
jgi:hypothetical protein